MTSRRRRSRAGENPLDRDISISPYYATTSEWRATTGGGSLAGFAPDVGREAVDGLRPAGFHPVEHPPGRGDESDGAGSQRQPRLAVMLGEGDGGQPFEARIARRIHRDAGED